MDKNLKEKIEKRLRRAKRVRSRIFGTKERPRLSVFRSSKHIYVQAIDDENQHTIASSSSLEIKEKLTKSEKAKIVGKLIAERLLQKNIKKVVFDRNGYKYAGRIKALAEAARESGLEF